LLRTALTLLNGLHTALHHTTTCVCVVRFREHPTPTRTTATLLTFTDDVTTTWWCYGNVVVLFFLRTPHTAAAHTALPLPRRTPPTFPRFPPRTHACHLPRSRTFQVVGVAGCCGAVRWCSDVLLLFITGIGFGVVGVVVNFITLCVLRWFVDDGPQAFCSCCGTTGIVRPSDVLMTLPLL